MSYDQNAASLQAEVEALRKESEMRHDLLKIQHACSTELWNELYDLCLQLQSGKESPPVKVLRKYWNLSPESQSGCGDAAMKGKT